MASHIIHVHHTNGLEEDISNNNVVYREHNNNVWVQGSCVTITSNKPASQPAPAFHVTTGIHTHNRCTHTHVYAHSLTLSESEWSLTHTLTYLERRGEKVFKEPKLDWISCVFENTQHHYPAGCHGNEYMCKAIHVVNNNN